MNLPFGPRDFFGVFERYNNAIWPAQVALLVIAVIIVWCAIDRPSPKTTWAFRLLGLLWLWMGLLYQLTFFAAINPVARVFAVVFVIQAALLVWLGRAQTHFVQRRKAFRVTGWAFVIYAMVAYPFIGYAAGHRYPATVTFGLPCPTTIFTLGVLLWILPPRRWYAAAIPIVWSFIGTAAAIQLSVPQDYGLGIAGVIATGVLLMGRRSPNASLSSHSPFLQTSVASVRS